MSAAARHSQTKPGAANAAFGAHAPSVALPLAFILCGLLALCVGTGWLLFQPGLLATYHYNQSVIAVTHLFVLGWICSVVMGAMYQLVPVALETRLYSERLARWHFAFHFIGFTGMVWMFRVWNMKQAGHFGAILVLGVALLVYNVARTLRRVPKWSATATAVGAALFWIALAVTVGLCIAIAKSSYDTEGLALTQRMAIFAHGLQAVAKLISRFDAISTMHAHAHLGGVGFFTMLIVGVSYKLIPMFTLSEVQNERRAAGSLVLLNVGIAGSFVAILVRSTWKLAFALTVVAALMLYGWELRAILRARKRRMLDWGIKYFLTAVALLFPLAALAVVLSWPGLPLSVFTGQLENVYGFLALFGVISLAIIGMLYKIIPFLVWFGRYSEQVGRAKVPSLVDLYSPRLQALGYYAFLSGVFATCLATAFSSELGVRAGCGMVTVGVLTLALNVGMMLSHLLKPKTRPLIVQTTSIARPA